MVTQMHFPTSPLNYLALFRIFAANDMPVILSTYAACGRHIVPTLGIRRRLPSRWRDRNKLLAKALGR
jgi:hypothetical protein